MKTAEPVFHPVKSRSKDLSCKSNTEHGKRARRGRERGERERDRERERERDGGTEKEMCDTCETSLSLSKAGIPTSVSRVGLEPMVP